MAAALLREIETPESSLVLPASPAPRAGPSPFARRRRPWPLRAAGAAAKALALALAFYLLATSLLVACYRRVDPPVTVLMAWRKFGFGWRIEPPRPVPLRRIPSQVRRMLISVEDGKFYEHFGLDFEAFRNAREINARIGKPLYGGSTLTMQVARTLFLVPVKSYLRKGLEVLVALELELILPKERILELYFGYAEWGRGVLGIEAASRRYYGTGVQSLSRDEAARLVALLSSPIKYTPSTLSRNGILRERYAYLARRYVEARPAAPQAEGGAAPGGPGPAMVSPNALSTLDLATAPGGAPPPPSPEPGSDAGDEPADPGDEAPPAPPAP